jgi:hypothetical protein
MAAVAVAEAADERISFVFGKEVHHSHSYSRFGLRRYALRVGSSIRTSSLRPLRP